MDFVETHSEADGDRCELAPECIDVERLDDDVTVVQGQRGHQAASDEFGRESAGIGRAEPDSVRTVVHQVAQIAIVAAGDESTLRDDEDVRTESSDFVEHVARHEDAASLVAETVEQRDHPPTLHGVESGERFVEYEYLADR